MSKVSKRFGYTRNICLEESLKIITSLRFLVLYFKIQKSLIELRKSSILVLLLLLFVLQNYSFKENSFKYSYFFRKNNSPKIGFIFMSKCEVKIRIHVQYFFFAYILFFYTLLFRILNFSLSPTLSVNNFIHKVMSTTLNAAHYKFVTNSAHCKGLRKCVITFHLRKVNTQDHSDTLKMSIVGAKKIWPKNVCIKNF